MLFRSDKGREALRPLAQKFAESEALLVTLFRRWGGTLTRIAVSHVEPIGAFHAWRPLMPVTQLAVVKQ